MKIQPINTVKHNDDMIESFCKTDTEYNKSVTIYELFKKQASLNAEKTALSDKIQRYSYSELLNAVNKYCSNLQSLGIANGDIVAIHLNRSCELIIFQLAVLMSGAVFLPVDKRYPLERIKFMCEDCNVKLFVSDEIFELDGIPLISLAEFKSISADPAYFVFNNGVCYIIYTSGSTGVPKGCMLNCYGIVNFCINNNTLETLQNNTNNTFACVNSVSFDYFIAESLLPLLNGYTVVILDENESSNQRLFLKAVEKHNINVLMTTPTRLKMFYSDKEDCSVLKKLDCVVTSGEPLTCDLLEKIFDKSPNAQVYNPLGPSECNVWNTGGKLEKMGKITIGKPIANTQIYIVNKYMQIVPIGVTGEICIAGDGVGAGYLNRPKLTAEKFIDNPFGEGKLYKTGDLGYWREDGNIVYVGRNDFQVKIRGLRIELGEIENAISSVEGVSQAVVVVRKNSEGRQLICAFYSGKEHYAKDIRTEIGKRLPKYMLPHIFTHLDEMPLTPSGKLNRKALPEIDLENIQSDAEYVAPETESEKLLCAIMAKTLNAERVGLTDNFFDLGGDSLKAIELISECETAGLHISLQSVFDNPTPAELIKNINDKSKDVPSYSESDFIEIHNLIKDNCVSKIVNADKVPVGNLLLAGATGFLGVHILDEYLKNDTGTAYCIVRGKSPEDSRQRLNEYLNFYFGDTYIDNDRIVVLCGDVTEKKFNLSDNDYRDLISNVDTVINSVASVKHYGSYDFFRKTNVESVENIIEFCNGSNAKLIHISTTSVAGNDFDTEMSAADFSAEINFTEHDFFINQPRDNVYVRSKFEAEHTVLKAMQNGLQANIMRMGNLTNRRSDGKFQRNYESNAFLKHIKAIVDLGYIPYDLLDQKVEFTPIDDAAKAVMTITRHFRNDRNVFHVENINPISFDELHHLMSMLGLNMKLVTGEQFAKILREAENDPNTKYIFETFINEIGEDGNPHYDSPIKIDTEFTKRYLHNLGFDWHETDVDYLMKYFEYFKSIGYINI